MKKCLKSFNMRNLILKLSFILLAQRDFIIGHRQNLLMWPISLAIEDVNDIYNSIREAGRITNRDLNYNIIIPIANKMNSVIRRELDNVEEYPAESEDLVNYLEGLARDLNYTIIIEDSFINSLVETAGSEPSMGRTNFKGALQNALQNTLQLWQERVEAALRLLRTEPEEPLEEPLTDPASQRPEEDMFKPF